MASFLVFFQILVLINPFNLGNPSICLGKSFKIYQMNDEELFMGTLKNCKLNACYGLIMFDMLSLFIRIFLWIINCLGCYEDGVLRQVYGMLCRFSLELRLFLHLKHCSSSFFVMGSSFGKIFILIRQTFSFHRRIDQKF